MVGWVVLVRAAATLAAAAIAVKQGPRALRRAGPSVGDAPPEFDSILLKHGSSSSSLSLKEHGAHVCSWIPEGESDVFFVSDLAKYGPSDAIRGGIPLCFPQFGPRGDLPQHGFFRKSNDWVQSDSKTLPNGDVVVTLTHTDTPETRASAWPHKFEARYIVTLSKDTVSMKLAVRNTGEEDLAFTCALHTYFNVATIDKAQVIGLKGAEYEDSADGGKVKQEEADSVTFQGEVDRVYGPTAEVLSIKDGKRTVEIKKDGGFPDAVVWNPWADKARALADLPDEAYKQFVCVEVGAIRTPVKVAAGEEWSGTQVLCVRK